MGKHLKLKIPTNEFENMTDEQVITMAGRLCGKCSTRAHKEMDRRLVARKVANA